MDFDLTSLERKIIISALTTPQFKDLMKAPALHRVVRDSYKTLLARLKSDEVLHQEIKKSIH